jgi:hypothetical protein
MYTYLELLVSLGEDDKLGHEGDVDGLLVEVGGHLGGLRHVATVHQPEPRRDLANTKIFFRARIVKLLKDPMKGTWMASL